jgi:hypothetical protein
VNLSSLVGLAIVLAIFGLMLFFAFRGKRSSRKYLREIAAFTKLRRGIGLAVEAGQRLHISLGHGGVSDVRGASTLVGLSMLQRVARAASISDRPPVATSGEATQAVLSQDTLRSAYNNIGAAGQYDPDSGLLTGVTPFSYAAGAMPVIIDQHVSMNILAGHFGSEVALITDAAERSGAKSLAGSDNITAQSVLFATADEPLVGEELYVAGAYARSGPLHMASLQAQDIVRWVVIGVILVGSALKLVGVW